MQIVQGNSGIAEEEISWNISIFVYRTNMRRSVPLSEGHIVSSKGAPQSVGRIFAILDSLAGYSGGISLAELAVKTSAPKTSLVGLLAGLIAENYLLRDEAGRYSLGPAFISLAMRATAGKELIKLAQPIMTELMEATGESVVIGALAPDEELAQYLAKVESGNPIRYTVTIGERRALFCTAMGKALLAGFDDDRLEKYLKSVDRRKFTPTTITSQKELRREMAAIREQGIARTINERIAGASGISVPIFSGDGEVVAGILIAGPSDRMKDNAEKNEKLLREAGVNITRLTGGRPQGTEN